MQFLAAASLYLWISFLSAAAAKNQNKGDGHAIYISFPATKTDEDRPAFIQEIF